ncbi:MAG: hypothetical protein A2V86_12055 [Deltaproteobacteria bacterium RBG_16_49_23]|nr:MAG: hypothetical protein A2V86_12055 [Deltaproteobacteria bacterium RBG_16_49_23]
MHKPPIKQRDPKMTRRFDPFQWMMKTLFCLIWALALFSCSTPLGPVKDPTNHDRILSAKHYIEGIKPEYQFGPECAPVSIKMVLQSHGINLSIQEVAEGTKQTLAGTSRSNIAPFVTRHGFKYREIRDYEFSKPWIKYYISTQHPVLVSGNHSSRIVRHMIVVMGYDDTKKRFYVLNPWHKGVTTMNYHEFMEWHTYKAESYVGVIYK